MSVFLRDYLTVVWFGLAALAIGGLLLGLAALVRPSRPNYDKGMAYESGVDPVGIGWSQSQIRYYVFALLFYVAILGHELAHAGGEHRALRHVRSGRDVDLHRVAARWTGVRLEAWVAPMGLTPTVTTVSMIGACN